MKSFKYYLIEISSVSIPEISELKKSLLKLKIKKVTPKKLKSLFLKPTRKIFKDHVIFNDDFLIFVGENHSNKDISPNTYNVYGSFVEGEVEDYEIDEPAIIYLSIMNNPKDKDITFNKEKYITFVNLYVDAVQHELVHFKQWLSKNYVELEKTRGISKKELKGVNSFSLLKKLKKGDYTRDKYKEDIQYYSQQFEMEAFALNAASELKRYYNSAEKAIKVLKNYSKINLKQSPVFSSYNDLFKPNSVIMKKFVKLVAHFIKEKDDSL